MPAANSGDRSPRVSVCIRACARPAELSACIESVLAQTYRDFEVIVADDSGDLGDVAEGFGDERIRHHPNPRPLGVTANLARAVELSRGEMIAVLDDDDRWLPGFLEATVAVLDGDPEVGVAVTDHIKVIGGRSVPRAMPMPPGRADDAVSVVLDEGVMTSTALIRRRAWDEGQRLFPLRPGLAGASLVFLRTAAAGWPFHRVPEPLAKYVIHGDQVTWRDPAIHARGEATLLLFEFADPANEERRLRGITEARLTQAAIELRAGRLGAARRHLGRARSSFTGRLGKREFYALTGARRWTLSLLLRHPRLVLPAEAVWHSLRACASATGRIRSRISSSRRSPSRPPTRA